MPDLTRLLEAAQQGDRQAAAQLLPLVYEELRKLAATCLVREKPGHTLQPTALVHEAYLRLVGGSVPQLFNDRGHFFGAAAEAMRRLLIESARRKGRIRHGGQLNRVHLDGDCSLAQPQPGEDLLALDEALQRFESDHPEAASVVKLRYFAGLTAEQAAQSLGISLRTANRHWAFARAWLFDALKDGQ